MFTERLITGDIKATFNQADLNLDKCDTDNFNKVLMKVTEHTFQSYAFCKWKRCIFRHMIVPWSIKLSTFISRLQKLNKYFEGFLHSTSGQEIFPLPMDEIMDMIYHSMSTTWKNMMIGQSKTLINFFETRMEI